MKMYQMKVLIQKIPIQTMMKVSCLIFKVTISLYTNKEDIKNKIISSTRAY